MPNPLKHPSHSQRSNSLLLTAALAALATFAGCDKLEHAGRQGDKDVEKQLVKADVDRSEGADRNKAQDRAVDDLRAAAAISAASPAGQVQARGELAREQFERALRRMPEIARRTQEIDLGLWELASIGDQIRTIQAANTGYVKLDPAEALDTAKKAQEADQAAITKAKSDAAAAQAELDKRQKEIDGLKAQRTAAETEAESLTQKSAAAKGKDSVDLFRQSTDAGIKAGTLAAQIEIKNAALVPFQHSLAIAQEQQKFWEESNKELDARKSQLDTSWQAVQAQMKGVNDLAGRIATQSLTPKSDNKRENTAARLARLTKENDQDRAAVAQDLSEATQNYDAAAVSAKTVRDQVAARAAALTDKNSKDSVLPALATLVYLYDENNYLLPKGHAQSALAGLLADSANETRLRAQVAKQLADALKGSNIPLPKELAVTDADATAAAAKADAAYTEATKTLDAVASAERNTPDAPINKNAALLSLVTTRIGQYYLADDAAKAAEIRAAIDGDITRVKSAELESPATAKLLPSAATQPAK